LDGGVIELHENWDCLNRMLPVPSYLKAHLGCGSCWMVMHTNVTVQYTTVIHDNHTTDACAADTLCSTVTSHQLLV
jgi:hypothetical protein